MSSEIPDINTLLNKAIEVFIKEFNEKPEVAACAPGRVNLIGEHTDYNDGFVLPMALPLVTIIVGKKSSNNSSTIITTNPAIEQKRVLIGKPIKRDEPKWANYIRGVIVNYLGNLPPNFDAVIVSSVPTGGGLSSSASLEVAMYTFLDSLAGPSTIMPTDKALACQKAEHDYAGVPCGIMDQFISVLGKENNALLIDCRKMGRKIPGKKHRGVKDPDKQREVRFKSIKDKINAPPKNLEQNEIPKSLQRIINFKERLKAGQVSLKRQRKKTKSKLLSSETKSRTQKIKQKLLKDDKKERTPAFIQMPGETDRNFMRRIHTVVDSVIKEAKFEDKYGVKVKRNYETGEVEDVVKQPKDELVELIKDIKKKEKNKGKKKKKESDEPKLTKSQKKQRKLAEKKAKKIQTKPADFDDYKDTVSFGDIVHAPPVLNAPKKVHKLNCAPRPGKKDLLLKTVIKEGEKNLQVKQPSNTKKSVFDKIQHNKVDKKGKRKDLPNAVRRQLETQRNEVVNAYRMIKAKKSVITI